MLMNAKMYVEIKMEQIKARVLELDKTPKLAIIQVEGNSASDKYVANKMKKCAEAGIDVKFCYYGKEVDSETLEDKIQELNNDPDITGMLLQLPLPEHLDEHYLTNLIAPEKDVDGFTIYNTGALSLGMDCNVACTPKGIIDLLRFFQIQMVGRDVLIINDSNIVGKPLAQLFLREGATVTIAHKRTQDLKDKIKRADIVVTAVGIANFLHNEDFTYGTTIVDVGINFVDGKMCGDVCKSDYEALSKRCNLTPVPGGVGQTTVMSVLDNVVTIAERNENGGM